MGGNNLSYFAVGTDMRVYSTPATVRDGWCNETYDAVSKIDVVKTNPMDSIIFGLGTENNVWQSHGKSWIQLTRGKKVTSFFVHENTILGLGADDGAIYKAVIVNMGSSKASATDWVSLTKGKVRDFTVSDGVIYGVGMDRAVWKHSVNGSGDWHRITHGSIQQVEVRHGIIYALGMDRCVYKWSGSRWDKFTEGRITQFVLSEGYIHGLHEDQSIWRVPITKGGAWKRWSRPKVTYLARPDYLPSHL